MGASARTHDPATPSLRKLPCPSTSWLSTAGNLLGEHAPCAGSRRYARARDPASVTAYLPDQATATQSQMQRFGKLYGGTKLVTTMKQIATASRPIRQPLRSGGPRVPSAPLTADTSVASHNRRPTRPSSTPYVRIVLWIGRRQTFVSG